MFIRHFHHHIYIVEKKKFERERVNREPAGPKCRLTHDAPATTINGAAEKGDPLTVETVPDNTAVS